MMGVSVSFPRPYVMQNGEYAVRFSSWFRVRGSCGRNRPFLGCHYRPVGGTGEGQLDLADCACDKQVPHVCEVDPA